MTARETIGPFINTTVFFFVFFLLYICGKLVFSSPLTSADYNGPSENLFDLHIPKDLHFAGERIPQNDYSIKETMEKVMNGGRFERSTAYVLFSRASSWFPLIEKILKKNKVPEDLKYVALAESRLTNSTSSQGAVGFWQFIGSTGRNYGLEINEQVDERLNVEKSTEAACRFFKDAHRRLGNWTLVAAAYNLGMGGIEQHIKKQSSKNYYDLTMNKETSVYIYRILALKTIFMNSGKKFTGGRTIYNTPCITFKVDSTINDLGAFAFSKGYSAEILKMFNPWFITNSLQNPDHKSYTIRFPKKEFLKKYTVTLPEIKMSPETVNTSILPTDTNSLKTDTLKEIKNEPPQQ